MNNCITYSNDKMEIIIDKIRDGTTTLIKKTLTGMINLCEFTYELLFNNKYFNAIV